MKNIFLIILLIFSTNISAEKKPLVVASASMLLDMLEVIGEEFVETDVIVPIGSDPHLHEATPRDVSLVSKADLVLVNGLTFEGWLNELIENSGGDATVVTVTQGVNAIESSEYENSADPHAWMNVANVIIYCDNIRKALSELVPEEAESFLFNFNVYKTQLEDLHSYVQESIATIPVSKRVLITSHDAFSYYGRAYGLELHALTGVSTEADPQTSDIIRVNKIIKERKIPAIFMESTINPKLLQELAKDNKIAIGGKLYADSLGDKGGSADTYIKMIKHNTDVIVEALLKETTAGTDTESLSSPNQLYLIIAVIFLAFVALLYFIFKR